MLVKKCVIDRAHMTVRNDALWIDDVGLGNPINPVIDPNLAVQVERNLPVGVAVLAKPLRRCRGLVLVGQSDQIEIRSLGELE